MRVYRLNPETGTKQYLTKEAGCFILGDPKNGTRKHIAANKVAVRTEQEMVDLIMRGFSVRVDTKTRPSLVRLHLFVDGKKVLSGALGLTRGPTGGRARPRLSRSVPHIFPDF